MIISKEFIMKIAVVTSKGQITIPIDIRKLANIDQGTRLSFELQNDGSLCVRPLSKPISALKGIVKSKKRKPVSLSEMKKAISRGIEDKIK
jgi:antitoxin PrlF